MNIIELCNKAIDARIAANTVAQDAMRSELEKLGYTDGYQYEVVPSNKKEERPRITEMKGGTTTVYMMYNTYEHGILGHAYVLGIGNDGTLYRPKGPKPKLKKSGIEAKFSKMEPVGQATDAEKVAGMINRALLDVGLREFRREIQHPHAPPPPLPGWLADAAMQFRVEGGPKFSWKGTVYIIEGGRNCDPSKFDRWREPEISYFADDGRLCRMMMSMNATKFVGLVNGGEITPQ